MKIAAALGLSLGLLVSGFANAEGIWRFEAGIAYVTGIDDVADHYEENLQRAGFDVDVDVRVPVGVGAKAIYLWSSNLRADLGLGPMFFISGDVNHFELPVSATMGYSFMPNSGISPYVRAGLVYHYVDGDQYSDTSPGPLVAVGVELTRLTIEIASDRSEVEFDALDCSAPGACVLTTDKLHTYEIMASVFYRF